MSDDLVKRLRTPWDADRSIISQTDNWMRERQKAADRIEQLVAINEELETKLAKAVEALGRIADDCEADYPPSHGAIKHDARTTLAELSGQMKGQPE